MYHLVYIILPICQSASIGTLMAITADRFRAIVFPVKSPLTRKTVSSDFAILDRFSDHCIAWISSLLRFHITWCCVQRGRLAIRVSGAHWMSTRYPILSFCQESLRIASEKVPIPLLWKINDATIYQSRWSGDEIWRTGEKNFNAVFHNRARP